MVSLATLPEENAPRPRWRDTLRLVGEVGKAKPLASVAMLVVVLVANSRAGLYIAVQGGIVDALLEENARKAVIWALVFVGVNAVEEAYWTIKPWLFAIINDHAAWRFQRRVMERAAAVPLVAFEHGPFFARLKRASDDLGGRFSNMLMSLFDSLQLFTMGASIMVTVWLVSPWLPIVILVAAIPAVWIELQVAGAIQEALRRRAPEQHLLGRLEEIIRDRNTAAELRLFGNGPTLARHWLAARTAIDDDHLAAETRRLKAFTTGEFIRQGALGVAVAIALWAITDRRLSVGTWVVAITGIQWFSGFAQWTVHLARDARENVAYAGDLFEFEDLADQFIADAERARADVPATAAAAAPGAGMEVIVDSVSFAYPGTAQPVVRDFSLTIPRGQTVAIVGENGAGKSTLARLLSGLYLPDQGAVCLDGIDTRGTGMAAVTPRIGAVFQDFLPFQLPLRDNIAFGNAGREPDPAALDRAAAQAGLTDFVASLPEGYDTWLGRQFGERDLSGGQWQRVALARAFYRDADLVILDEPTAALDPRAEQALFDRFAELMQDRTAIMISHRLGSARHADRILVMDGGRLVEDGTHDALIAAGGLYASMFAAQAAWYRPNAALGRS